LDFDVLGWASVGQKSIQYKVFVQTDEIIAKKNYFQVKLFLELICLI
jgi:hypothetical protein